MTVKKDRCVIIGGAPIGDYPYIRSMLQESDYFVFCDSGLTHMESLRVKPDLIVGDFDSIENPHMDIETIVLPCEKDDTDTYFAAKEGLKRGYREFLLIGVIGARLDHSLGNVSILMYLTSQNAKGVILDDYSQMEIVTDEPVCVEDSWSYFSLLCLTGSAEGVTVENAKYPLNDGVITSSYAYGVSNEVLPGKTAAVFVKKGNLLLIKIR